MRNDVHQPFQLLHQSENYRIMTIKPYINFDHVIKP